MVHFVFVSIGREGGNRGTPSFLVVSAQITLILKESTGFISVNNYHDLRAVGIKHVHGPATCGPGRTWLRNRLIYSFEWAWLGQKISGPSQAEVIRG